MEIVQELDQTTSTNDEIKQAIDRGEAEGLSVRALKQTAGYGRQGRSWESPLGGLYQSFLMRPQISFEQLPTLSLVMGMAVCNTVREILPETRRGQIMVKWPNDVVLVEGRNARVLGLSNFGGADSMMGGFGAGIGGMAGGFDPYDFNQTPLVSGSSFKKIAGISLERYKDAVCVGIGINVAAPEPGQGDAEGEGDAAVPEDKNAAGEGKSVAIEDVKNKAVYLEDLGFWAGSVKGRIAQVSKVLTQKVWAQYSQWQRIGFGVFSQSFNAYYNALAGQHVSMVDINGKPLTSGRVEYVDGFGELVLLNAQGYEESVSSGEAHIV